METYELKSIPIMGYLASLGFQPQKRKPSCPTSLYYVGAWRGGSHLNFEVDTIKNLWHDHKECKGGSIIDLDMYLHGGTVHQAMMRLTEYGKNNCAVFNAGALPEHAGIENSNRSHQYFIEEIDGRNLNALYYYLRNRKIEINVAARFCVKIIYTFGGGRGYAIGFPTDAGGWVIRNEKRKFNLGPAGISTIRFNRGCSWAVFEGFFDFLSFVQEYGTPCVNCIVLNSVVNIERAYPILDTANRIYMMLDNDEAGKKNTSKIASRYGNKVEDKSYHYAPYNDYNEYLMHR